jgi:3-oxoadipate enol-lactonase
MPYVHVNNTAIYYEEAGSGPALVLLHGLGTSHAAWRPQVEHFKPSHRVITPDLRGFGRSGSLRSSSQAIETQAADLLGLLDKLELAQAVLAGTGYGSAVLQRFALDYKARVRGLVIADSPGEGRRGFASSLLAPAYLLPGRWLAAAVERHYARSPLAQRILAEETRRMRGLETFRARLALNRVDYGAELRALDLPALCLVGDASEAHFRMMKALADTLPHARLELIQGAFEPSNLTQPEAFNRFVGEFLESLGWTAKGQTEAARLA